MYSIIIPIFNEQETIPELYRRLKVVIDKLDKPVEVILVDDGSRDQSLKLLKEIHQKDARIKLLSFSRNFGHQVAISAGLDHASGEAVIIMDSDLQDPPELIPKMIDRWEEGNHVVYTVKRSRKENIFKKFAFHSFYKLMLFFSSIPIPIEAGNFSLIDQRVVKVIKEMPERNRYISGMRAWAGFKQTMIEFDRDARFAGKPQMTFVRLFNFALDGIFSFSKTPLRFSIFIGSIIALLSFCGTIYVVYAKLFTDKATPGWASPVVSILFIGGIILLMLGIIGEYIGRIYDEVKMRPLYIIRDKIGFSENSIQ
ncbi:MAG: glycosyltransferase family 2 protein [Bacteroidota bacterium]|nr:glycosyltransferase family 2 protein [Bacteroidota bacterium]